MNEPRRRPHLLSHLVQDAAARDPDALALVGGDQRLTAAELADRVARLAGALRSRGVGDGDRVMVYAPKSPESFVAMHAAMHAGAIAVPVNPRSATAAMRDLVASIEPRAVVLGAATAARWPTDTAVLRVGVDDGALTWAETDASDPIAPRRRTGDDPAYMITTSGSTGRPKSIVHTHRSGLRYAELGADCFGLRPDDRMANVAPFHFDQSTFELYAAPLAGAGVVLVPDALLRFPASVAELIETEQITVWYSVPTILRQLLERGALTPDRLRSLRRVLFGGELFPAADLRAWMELAPGARFTNVYGPAEVNQCTHHHLDEPPADDESIPIGGPWDDTRVRIEPLDDDPDLGELLVHTTTAMAGYWRRPDLTAAAFDVELDAGGLPTRWYRTGDIVERDDRGRLHFRGRRDRQVKVKGVRIELEAVESVLNAIPGVTASAAGVTASGSLGALVETDGSVDLPAIRSFLRSASTPGAEPEHITLVDRLPRTGSDKVDLAASTPLIEALDTNPPSTP